MNLSGRAVVALLRKYKIDLDEALVICDDLNLELGRIKLRPSGSSAGQRGLKSIIETLGSNEFGRLRIGIGRPNNMDAASYVLSSFAKRQKEQLKEIIIRACDCCEMWVKEGMSKSMNIFNKRSKNE
jgi:PTH1 family peptidyl-tRNA hydrolase